MLIKMILVQVTTSIAEKTVRPLKSAIAVVSAKTVVACIHKKETSLPRDVFPRYLNSEVSLL